MNGNGAHLANSVLQTQKQAVQFIFYRVHDLSLVDEQLKC